MKVTVNRKEMLNALKGLIKVSAAVSDSGTAWKNVVGLFVGTDRMILFSGQLAFVLLTVPVDVEKSGSCHVDINKLHDLLKVAKDEIITLSAEKVLTVTSDRGFQARLALLPAKYPLESVLGLLEGDIDFEVTIYTSELEDLCHASQVFDPMGKFRYAKLWAENDGTLLGETHQTEEGGVEYFPFNAENVPKMRIIFNPEYALSVLSLIGECVTLKAYVGHPAQIIVTDPNNTSVVGCINQLNG